MSEDPPINGTGAYNAMEIVVCETVAAITTHLRKVTPATPINYSGFTKRPKTLCDKDAAWDTKLPIAAARCRDCIAIYNGDTKS